MPLTLPPLPAYPATGHDGEQAAWRELADLHIRNAQLQIAEERAAQAERPVTPAAAAQAASAMAGVMPSPLAQITSDLVVARMRFDSSITQQDVDACTAAAKMILASAEAAP